MASVKVAVRVRPFNQREKDMNAKLIVQMEGKKTRLLTVKNSKEQNEGNREKYKDFTFDHSYWSYDNDDDNYASQEQVFSDLGLDVIDSAFEGYNACVFAYGQTGSGKTFTMMGSMECQGLIPRICRQLFSRVAAGKESGASYRTEVSYLEIYNERVKDLLATDAGHSLRVREHPKLGPYVQDLSKHLVSDYDDIQECMHRGNLQRTTASTQMNDVSSRSHAIFTVTFVQASYLRHNNMPSETVSKVHLVDLAGSERADATGATGQRLVEGAHINKSLVTLGSVISALAEASQHAPDNRNQKGGKKVFIPYRDSVLTWLLKDSLGGNSKTIMIAAISPADCNYGETLSTLRYANRAKNIINQPTINEDPNVKLIRELREEIDKLRAQITHNTDPIETIEPGVLATLQRKEAQEKVLTEKWTEKWRETQQILQEQKALGLRKSGLGVVLDSDMPHLVGIDDNLLSTGVTLYHLKEGETVIGTAECPETPDIVLRGPGVLARHCVVRLRSGEATLEPAPRALCWLNTVLLDKPAKLSQGCIILLGRTNMFRYNDPAEAAKLRQEGTPAINLSRLSLLSWSTTDLATSTDNLDVTTEEPEDRSEKIEEQRAELERERQKFFLQQEERQKRWHAEREELRKEREAMEREYSEACARLSGDWKALERGWSQRRRALRSRQRELAARSNKLRALQDTHKGNADNEEGHIKELKVRVEEKMSTLEEVVRSSIRELVEMGFSDEALSASDESDMSPEASSECLSRLLEQCSPSTSLTIKMAVDKHKKELLDLEEELQSRITTVTSHRNKITRLQSELELLSAQEAGLRRLAAALCVSETDTEPSERVKRSKSELVLRESSDTEPLSDIERGHYRTRRASLTLSLEPLTTPTSTINTDESFHTATSSPKPFPNTDEPTSTTLPTDIESGCTGALTASTTDASTLESESAVGPGFKLGKIPVADDSDDMSSTEDYHKPRIVEGQSSSSVERSPDERQQRTKYRRRIADNKGGRRQVTEAEALRAMQRLCCRIASQKMLVISSLENDCSKEELNRQIAVLQELQKKYVRLEMALQYSLFTNAPPRADTHDTTDRTEEETHEEIQHPLLHRVKESELEGSDNMSTSNDETSHDKNDVDASSDSDRSRDHTLLIQNPSIGLSQPVNFDDIISIPGYVVRGAGASTHHEYEVRVSIGSKRCLLLRRYRRFRDLYLEARRLYGPKVAAIPFPPRHLWSSDALARARRPLLERFVRRLLAECAADARCPLHAAVTPHTLVAFSLFFRKGVFESGKCGTG